ncbi:hypothetical protein [Paenibacillus abyssi]|uniref:hypothetical protein n=1 Tax=Paenibacillus abyssi TaxID=1340531 RepID=UPI0016680E69
MNKMNKWVIIVIVFSVLSMLHVHMVKAAPVQIILTVKASPDSSRATILTIKDIKLAERIIRSETRTKALSIPVSDVYLTLRNNGLEVTYLLDHRGNLYNEQNRELIEVHADVKRELIKHAEECRAAHYGKIISWVEAKTLIPKKMKFKVIDMETGITFHVQRRAGSSHADVQPLTKKDTAAMKQIYNGHWSWHRKAILVQTDHELLAASMHGMPHGGDGIPDNDFSGHFCIHFLGSSVHGSGNIDPEHQLMVHKAGGKLREYVDGASPYEMADIFISALNLKETQILKMIFPKSEHKQLEHYLQMKEHITGIRKRSDHHEQDVSDLLEIEIPVDVSIYQKAREERARLTFTLSRLSLIDPWKIDSIT